MGPKSKKRYKKRGLTDELRAVLYEQTINDPYVVARAPELLTMTPPKLYRPKEKQLKTSKRKKKASQKRFCILSQQF